MIFRTLQELILYIILSHSRDNIDNKAQGVMTVFFARFPIDHSTY